MVVVFSPIEENEVSSRVEEKVVSSPVEEKVVFFRGWLHLPQEEQAPQLGPACPTGSGLPRSGCPPTCRVAGNYSGIYRWVLAALASVSTINYRWCWATLLRHPVSSSIFGEAGPTIPVHKTQWIRLVLESRPRFHHQISVEPVK